MEDIIYERLWTQKRRTRNLSKFLEQSLQEYRLVTIRNTSGFQRERCGLNSFSFEVNEQKKSVVLSTSIYVTNMSVFKQFKVFGIGKMGTCGITSLPFLEFWPIFSNNTIIVDQPFSSKVNVGLLYLSYCWQRFMLPWNMS